MSRTSSFPGPVCYMNYMENDGIGSSDRTSASPLPANSDVRSGLIAEGRLIHRLDDSRDLPPPVDDPGLRPTSEILDGLREDRL